MYYAPRLQPTRLKSDKKHKIDIRIKIDPPITFLLRVKVSKIQVSFYNSTKFLVKVL